MESTCDCGRSYTQEQSSGRSCFACKLNSVGFAFRGATGRGRKAFHDTTIREAVLESDRSIRAAGGDPKKDYAFSGNRWI